MFAAVKIDPKSPRSCCSGIDRSSDDTGKVDQLILAEQYSQALELIFPLASSGDIKAQLRLANMYYQGQGLEKNYDKASYWICRASETDNFTANKFRIKISLSMISEDYQPKQCSSIMDIVEN